MINVQKRIIKKKIVEGKDKKVTPKANTKEK